MTKIWRDRDWLWERYIIQEESTYAIAKEAGCSLAAIYRGLHGLDIPIRVNNGLWQNRDWLWEQYIVREKSSVAVAKEAKCSDMTIRNWLYRYEIPIRERGEAVFLATRNSVIITPDLLKFLKGEILGDGRVAMPGKWSARYQHSSAIETYLAWLSGRFDAWGIKQAGRIIEKQSKQNGAIYYQYTSRFYPELVPIYKRWYPNDKKVVPKDLRLTPIMVRQWYIGDGELDHPKHERPFIEFNTQGFDKESVKYLAKELNDLGFRATRQPSENKIRLWVCSVPNFLKWIGPCPISCYDYKWDY